MAAGRKQPQDCGSLYAAFCDSPLAVFSCSQREAVYLGNRLEGETDVRMGRGERKTWVQRAARERSRMNEFSYYFIP